MKLDIQKKIVPHIIAILVFLFISLIFASPLFQGQRLKTHDYAKWQGISKEMLDYQKKENRAILWTNSIFGGMPTYIITTPKMHNIFDKILKAICFNNFRPFDHIFWYFMGFYIMLLIFKIDPKLALFGSVAFGLSSYLYIIISAGHVTKAISIGFMAPIIGGIYLAYYRKKIWAGMIIMSSFLAIQMAANHMQVTYYTYMIALTFVIFEFFAAIKEKHLLAFFKASLAMIIGVIFAIGINAAHFITTKEYLAYSIRGKSELSSAQEDRTSGLDKSYAVQWSYGIDETLSLLIPNIKGGASTKALSKNSETYEVIKNTFGTQTANQVIKNMPMYFGNQPFTSGPVYVGAFVVLLFIFAFTIVKGRIKWWILTATVLSIMLAWGKNFMWFSDIFLDYFPYYNRFRVVAMTLLIAEFTIPLLAVLGIKELLECNYSKQELIKKFNIALSITILITLIYIAVPTIGGVEGENQTEYALARDFASYIPAEHSHIRANFENSLIEAIHNDRASMVRSDAFRSLIFILIGAIVVYLIILKKIKTTYGIVAMTLIVLIDMAVVSKRYLNNDNFTSRRNFEKPYLPTKADDYIMADNQIHFRVLNLSVSTFNDGTTSMFHKSVGGYHAVKMRRYQELYDSVMWRNFADFRHLINAAFQSGANEKEVQEIIDIRANFPVLNMLNTKYIIYHPEMRPLINNKRFGNAWFVSSHIFANNADMEIAKMKLAGSADKNNPNYIDLRNTAIISKAFEKHLDGFEYKTDTNATIKLVEYAPDYLIYEFNSKTDQLTVFSEIFYPHGWKISINEEDYSHFRANYVLRAMIIPAGNHTIKFSFESESYKKGVLLSYLSSIILLVLIFAKLFIIFKKRKNNTN